jgi:hypothetical protein
MASQTACGIVHLFVLLPVIIFMLPEQSSSKFNQAINFKYAKILDKSLKYIPSFGAYFEMLRDTKFLWSLIFVIVRKNF